MIVKQVKKSNQFDVFSGIGWSNWTRVEKHGGYLKHVNGVKLNRFQILKVVHILEEGKLHNPQPKGKKDEKAISSHC